MMDKKLGDVLLYNPRIKKCSSLQLKPSQSVPKTHTFLSFAAICIVKKPNTKTISLERINY